MAARLSNEEFLTSLSALLSTTHSVAHGSVYLTQKPLSAASGSPAPDSSSPSSSQILIRATNGLSKAHRTSKSKSRPKTKISTVVDITDLESFYTRYAEVCKKGMEGLRKRDKKKAKEKAKAKKKGKGVGGPPARPEGKNG